MGRLFLVVLLTFEFPTRANLLRQTIGRLKTACARVLSASKPSEIARLQRLQKIRDRNFNYLKLVAYGYLVNEPDFTWNWERKHARLQFAPNHRPFNDTLFSAVRLVALLSDGYAGEDRAEEKDLSLNLKTLSYRVKTNDVRPTALRALSAQGPHESALVQELTLEATGGPIGEPTVHLIDDVKFLFRYADRLATLNVDSDFAWLEIVGGEQDLKRLKATLTQVLDASR